MNTTTFRPQRLFIYRSAAAMRTFEHAAATRDVAESIVVRVEFSDGLAGWGQTLPRPYVTGETLESVAADLENILWPHVADKPLTDQDAPPFVSGRACSTGCAPDPKTRGASPAANDGLPDLAMPLTDPSGRCINAAACAMDLACLRRIQGATGLPPLRRTIESRVSGVLGSRNVAKTAKRTRLMRLAGLRDFKLKLGLGDDLDRQNLAAVLRLIGRDIHAGGCTLRVDVNGGWNIDETPARVEELKALGICAVEQPAYIPAAAFVELARKCSLPLIADEALLTKDDANTLLTEPQKIWWNIRLSKNGGLVNSLLLAHRAAAAGVTWICGAMVGESSILSAAQRRLLQYAPPARFIEGNYGRLLVKEDLTPRSLRFGYAGKLKPLPAPTPTHPLGISIDPARVLRCSQLLARLEA
ncbi:MAG: enolase C-terminal domain-like protein [Planctomycetaceae bacterium]|nr:hypothetical protein [Planctomycetaceae bacterium]